MTADQTVGEAAWEGALTCTCGRPYILLKVDEAQTSKRRELQPLAVYVRCPVHRKATRILLPYSQLSEWIGAAADRLFRCNTCGAPAFPQKVGVKGHWTILLLECPTHGTKDNKRILWTPIYTAARAVQEIAKTETTLEEELFEEEDVFLPRVCPHCYRDNDADARYCAFCGQRIGN
ncbi:MAG: hypothetical protein ACFFCO_00525 [Promethearchaeota archaeon]